MSPYSQVRYGATVTGRERKGRQLNIAKRRRQTQFLADFRSNEQIAPMCISQPLQVGKLGKKMSRGEASDKPVEQPLSHGIEQTVPHQVHAIPEPTRKSNPPFNVVGGENEGGEEGIKEGVVNEPPSLPLQSECAEEKIQVGKEMGEKRKRREAPYPKMLQRLRKPVALKRKRVSHISSEAGTKEHREPQRSISSKALSTEKKVEARVKSVLAKVRKTCPRRLPVSTSSSSDKKESPQQKEKASSRKEVGARKGNRTLQQVTSGGDAGTTSSLVVKLSLTALLEPTDRDGASTLSEETSISTPAAAKTLVEPSTRVSCRKRRKPLMLDPLEKLAITIEAPSKQRGRSKPTLEPLQSVRVPAKETGKKLTPKRLQEGSRRRAREDKVEEEEEEEEGSVGDCAKGGPQRTAEVTRKLAAKDQTEAVCNGGDSSPDQPHDQQQAEGIYMCST